MAYDTAATSFIVCIDRIIENERRLLKILSAHSPAWKTLFFMN